MSTSKPTANPNDSINHGASTSAINSADDSNWSDFCDESVLKMLDEPFDAQMDHSSLRNDEKYFGFDNNAGDTWIYPSNYPIRHYQYNITKAALFRNTLVVLPTGLGKTFIAAVVMYNIYRWYPTGKVIFMAPTKPLVSQQIEACRKIMGIPMKDTAEITGKQSKNARRDLWQTKRVFFVTPHVVQSDTGDNEQNFPFDEVRLVVVDEAHKAKGRYAHAEAVQAITSRNSNVRILGLSATPGNRIDDVMEVIKNLFISHLEIRWENSLDVLPYTHKKSIKTVVVPLGEDLAQIRNDFIDIIDPYIRYLIENQVLSCSNSSLTRGLIVMEQKRFAEMSLTQKHPNESHVRTNFSICISLYYALELLERHGARVFLNFFDDPNNETTHRYYVATNPNLRQFLCKLRKYVGPNPFAVNDQTMTNGIIPEIPKDLDFGHPKFTMVKSSLIAHFQEKPDSRVIVFCEFRESVLLMYRALLQSRPLVKPRVFVGQGGTGSIRAVTQKQQLEAMQQFRDGVINTLIATSVAEEGIDVGEVDLIVCFDISTKNPTRFVQRIGRTGRRRKGSILMMVTEGKEHAVIKEVLQSKDKLNQKVVKSREIARMLFPNSPRIVPPEFNPKCIEMCMVVNDEVEEKPSKAKKVKETKPKAAKKTKPIAPSQKNHDVRNFFKKVELDKDEQEIFCSTRLETTSSRKSDSEGNDSVINDVDELRRNINAYRLECLKPESADSEDDIGKILKSSDLNRAQKRLVLKSNVDYVKEKYDAIVAINALQDEDNVQGMFDAELSLRIEFTAIEEVIGKGMVGEFLIANQMRESPNLFGNKFDELFEGLETRSFSDCVETYIEEKNAELGLNNEVELDGNDDLPDQPEVYDDLVENQSQVLDIPKSDHDDDMFEEIVLENESRYMSQWTQFDRDKISGQSTPLRTVSKIGSSMANTNGKELFPIDELFEDDDPFGVAEVETEKFEPFEGSKNVVEPTHGKTEPHNVDNDFDGVAEVETEKFEPFEKSENVVQPTHGKTEPQNDDNILFDDDFDDFLVNANFITQVERVESKEIIAESQSQVTVDYILKLADEKEKELKSKISSRPNVSSESDLIVSSLTTEIKKNSSHDNLTVQSRSCLNPLEATQQNIDSKFRNGIEDFDLTEFFEPFDCEEAEVEQKKTDLKNCDKSVNLFETTNVNSNSPKSAASVPRQLSKELFISADQNLSVLKSYNVSLSPSNSKVPTPNFTSPSVLKNRPNLGRLRLTCSSATSLTTDITSPDLPRLPEAQNHLYQDVNILRADAPITPKAAANVLSQTQSPFGAFAFQRKNKRLIMSSDSEVEEFQKSQEENNANRANRRAPKRRKIRRNRCEFIDDEAVVSGDDEHEEPSEYSQFKVDSIVVLEDEEDDPDVDMRAKYLQSIRSPRKGAFKIPAPRTYNDMSHIFSQAVPYEGNSVYKEDSFVVISDEEDDYVPSQECPLERAEAILKARRRAKRKNQLYDEEDNHALKVRDRNFQKIYTIKDSSEDESG